MIKVVVLIPIYLYQACLTLPAPAKLILRWISGQFEIIVSEQVLKEYFYVLHHIPGVDQEKAHNLLTELKSTGITVNIPDTLKVCKDADDDKFLETALVGNADLLVTKNIKHYPVKSYQNVQIVKVSKFLSRVEKEFQE